MAKKVWTDEERAAFRARIVAGQQKARARREALGLPDPRRRTAAQLRAEAERVDSSSPEFEAVVAAAVAKALAAMPAVQAAMPAADPDARLRQLTEQLALSIGNLTNQNSGQTLVPPEVIAQRRDASRRMSLRIEEAKAKVNAALAAGDQATAAAEMPLYRLTAKIIAPLMNGDELIEPLRRGSDNIVRPVEIDWPLPPNLAMVPINAPALEIFALFKESIGNQISAKVVNVIGQGPDAAPQFAQEQDRYFLTNQGHAVTTGSASLMMKNGGDAPQLQTLAGRTGVAIRGDDPRRVQGGPPTMQVRVLGTIAPPAVQNG